jgi:hypothetical protein
MSPSFSGSKSKTIKKQREADSKQSNQLDKILDFVGNRREMQDGKSVPMRSSIREIKPIEAREQFTTSLWQLCSYLALINL